MKQNGNLSFFNCFSSWAAARNSSIMSEFFENALLFDQTRRLRGLGYFEGVSKNLFELRQRLRGF